MSASASCACAGAGSRAARTEAGGGPLCWSTSPESPNDRHRWSHLLSVLGEVEMPRLWTASRKLTPLAVAVSSRFSISSRLRASAIRASKTASPSCWRNESRSGADTAECPCLLPEFRKAFSYAPRAQRRYASIHPAPAGRRQREGQLEDRNGLARAPSRADGDDLVGAGEVDALDGDLHSEHLGLERQREAVFHHRVEPRALLRLPVGVDRGLFDHRLEAGRA